MFRINVLFVCGLVVLATAPSYAGLVSYWDFDDGTGSSMAADSVGGRTGNLTNMEAGSDWVAGHTGGLGDFALNFDGTNEYVAVPTYKGQTGRSARTTSVWINSSATNDTILAWGANDPGQKWVHRTQSSNGTPETLRVEVNSGYQVGSTDIVGTGWTHVAATWENDGSPNVTDVKLYVNGTLEANSASLTETLNTATSANFRIADTTFAAGDNFLGQIDDVAVWNRALTASEIASLNAGTLPTAIAQVVPQAALDYNAALDATPTNGTWEDLTNISGNHDWAINNNAGGARLVDVTAPGWAVNKAYSFNGGTDTATTDTLESFPGDPSNDSASFEILFRPSNFDNDVILFETGGTTGTSFALDDNATLLFTSASNSAASLEQLTYGGVTTDYLHAVGVIERVGSGATVSLYVNGLLVDSATSDLTDWTGANDAGLGQLNGTAGGNFGGILNGFGNFEGEISIFRFYDTLLTANDVLALYSAIAIPEPSTYALSLFALIGFAPLTSRRRQKRTA